MGFLAGYAAVQDGMTKLGYMGGMAVPAVVKYGYGFVQEMCIRDRLSATPTGPVHSMGGRPVSISSGSSPAGRVGTIS